MKKENGSYTVEAAFIVPMILGIVFMILYLILLYHDRVILRGELSNLLFLKTQEQETDSNYKAVLGDKLWIMEVTKGDIEEGVMQITGSVEAESAISIPLLTFMLDDIQRVNITEKYSALQPDQTRRYRKIKKKEDTD